MIKSQNHLHLFVTHDSDHQQSLLVLTISIGPTD